MQQFELIGKSHASSRPQPLASTSARADRSKGGEPTMTFSEWFEFAKANFRKEEGQTMAEYGVVLAVITLGIVATLVALSGGINGALNAVIGKL
jgi:Flp pilus assembly pilin Flp